MDPLQSGQQHMLRTTNDRLRQHDQEQHSALWEPAKSSAKDLQCAAWLQKERPEAG